ncbi:MAG TPA: hypothetical protein VFB10_03250 [Candidatus Dormibacteraeota bacterium]|nr:hypothetical protein [Candidatus Dormibacteraeota bacterium]
MSLPGAQRSEMNWQNISALRATASAFGVYAGLLGMEHGFFETLQGDVVPNGIKILAVAPPGLPFPFGHEPAMTLIPNFLVTGIFALIIGLLIVIWAAMFVQKKPGAVVLILLSIILLLVGGGFGPITLLITASIAAARIDKPLIWWRSHLAADLRRFLAKLWPGFLIAALLWVPFEFTLGYIFGMENDPKPSLTSLNLLLSYPLLAFFILTLITAFAHEVHRKLDLTLSG